MKCTHFFLISTLIPFVSQAMHFKNNKTVTIKFDFQTNTDLAKIICAQVKNNYTKEKLTKNYNEMVPLDQNGITAVKTLNKSNKNKSYSFA